MTGNKLFINTILLIDTGNKKFGLILPGFESTDQRQGYKFQIPKSQITNHKSINHKSEITNHKSKITNQKSFLYLHITFYRFAGANEVSARHKYC